MARKRLLILHSVRDHASERHTRQMSVSPRFHAFDIDHFFLLDQVGDRVDIAIQNMPGRLDRQIDSFRPDIVVVHVGMAYNLERKLYIETINHLVKANPAVHFVADRYLPNEEGFDGLRLGDDREMDQLILDLEGL